MFGEFTQHRKRRFPLRISSVNVTKSAVFCDLVTFTEEILNGKLRFLCSVTHSWFDFYGQEWTHPCLRLAESWTTNNAKNMLFFQYFFIFFNIFQYFFNSCNLWSFIVCTGETRCHFKDVIVNFEQLWLHSSIFLLNVSILFNALALSKFLLRIDQTKSITTQIKNNV